MDEQEFVKRLTRIHNLCDAALAIATDSASGAAREVLVSMLSQTWELCRDLDPDIIVTAGTAITPRKSLW